MVEYEATLEIPRGLFGILKERKSIGQVCKGKIFPFQIGQSDGTLFLGEYEKLLIGIVPQSPPVIVEFAAEPQRFWPKVVSKLDQEHPEIISGRRKITIYPEGDPKQRLILEAPTFQPLVVTSKEAERLIAAATA